MVLKLSTNPTTTATERHRREAGAVPVAPATRTMGSTGRMQGEMPVMSPATKPTRRRLIIPFRESAYPRPPCSRQCECAESGTWTHRGDADSPEIREGCLAA